jgi:hypothetical protein
VKVFGSDSDLVVRQWVRAVCLCFVVLAGPFHGVTDAESVFGDLSFRQGFLLGYSDASKGRGVEATLDLGRPASRPLWRLCQWGTKYSLADAACIEGQQSDVSYENEGKQVIVGGPASSKRDLVLEIRGQAEYGTRARQVGESWPHLLIEQDTPKPYRLDVLDRLMFVIRLRLLYCSDRMAEADYDPGLHAAQFQMFFIVKNINPQAADYGDFYWFGVPFFDNRYDSPPADMAKDAGKSDATGKFIYTVAAQEVGIRPLKGGQWIAVKTDLLDHIKRGLAEAVSRGYLNAGATGDYAVVNMNLGWEIPGTFDAAMQIRDLAISAVLEEGQP